LFNWRTEVAITVRKLLFRDIVYVLLKRFF
jgi:hypothetical protein